MGQYRPSHQKRSSEPFRWFLFGSVARRASWGAKPRAFKVYSFIERHIVCVFDERLICGRWKHEADLSQTDVLVVAFSARVDVCDTPTTARSLPVRTRC